MANDLTKNPWVIDTAGLLTLDLQNVKSLRWVSKTAAGGDQVILKDALGTRIIWESVATGANFKDETFFEEVLRDGMNLTTIGSGKFYVLLRSWE